MRYCNRCWLRMGKLVDDSGLVVSKYEPKGIVSNRGKIVAKIYRCLTCCGYVHVVAVLLDEGKRGWQITLPRWVPNRRKDATG